MDRRWEEEEEKDEEGKLEHFGKEARKWVVFFKLESGRMERGCEVKVGGWGCFEREEGEEGETAAVEGGEGFGREDGFLCSER